MIRILHVIATLDSAGAERQLVHLCRRLNRAEFSPGVCCLTRGGPLEKMLAEAGVPVWILHKRGKWDLTVLLRLRRVVREFRPDILHTWLPTANTLGRVTGILCGVPACIAAERAADTWKGWLRRRLDRVLERRTARIICNADAVRRFLTERIGLHAEKICVIRNGLDLDEFDKAAAVELPPPLPKPPEGPLLGSVGRLEPQKGMTFLIEAFKRLPASPANAHLWIVGQGPEEQRLRRQAADAGLEKRVHFLGLRKDVPALMARFCLFVLPSLWEGLPNAVLEAMAARRAVVATRVDGTPEAVVENETGLLVPPRDPEALAEAMTALLRDETRRARFGEAGRRRVEEVFDMGNMIARTQDLYREVLRKV